jgi:hypothetical protein
VSILDGDDDNALHRPGKAQKSKTRYLQNGETENDILALPANRHRRVTRSAQNFNFGGDTKDPDYEGTMRIIQTRIFMTTLPAARPSLFKELAERLIVVGYCLFRPS